MTTTKDPRRVVDASVHTKATHLTCLAECSRLYGSLAKTKLIDGTVKRVIIDRSMKRARTFIEAVWTFNPNKCIIKQVSLCNVVGGLCPETLKAEMLSKEQQKTIDRLVQQQSWDQDESLDEDNSPPHFVGEVEEVSPTLAASVHDVDWHVKEVNAPINGPVKRRFWSVRNCIGETIREGGGMSSNSPLFYFMTMFPHRHLPVIVSLTNIELKKKRVRTTTAGEVLKFFGILLLMSRWEFGKRRDLWATDSRNSLLPVPNFGARTGMPRDRFDSLLSSIQFSAQDVALEKLDSARFRWGLVEDVIAAFNEHRETNVCPSELICVDESISRWYGLGGDWIEIGLPLYVAIDRKPDNGCEIQNSACGRSGIMLHLELVSNAEDEAGREYEGNGLHGTAVLRRVVKPWAGTRRIVCADSYFASVEACDELERMGLRFIGVVKTATRRYPMKYLSELELQSRGDWRSVVRKDADDRVKQMAVVWMDRERRYFISNASSTLRATPYKRIRWRQLTEGPARTELTIDQPHVAEVYYSTCAKIDQHNRCRQKDLMLERKIHTVDWSFRVNCSILGMIIVDSWLLYSGEREEFPKLTQRHFYEDLAHELVFNTYDQQNLRPGKPQNSLEMEGLTPEKMTSGIGVHLTPTKRKRKQRNGEDTSYALQMCCKVCKRKTTHLCSECLMIDTWLCHTSTHRECFIKHLDECHK